MNSIKGENSMATKVNTYRTTAKAVGALYILGFVVGIAGSVLGAPGQLDTVSIRSMMIATGALLWVIAAAGDAAHGVMMFPILKQNMSASHSATSAPESSKPLSLPSRLYSSYFKFRLVSSS